MRPSGGGRSGYGGRGGEGDDIFGIVLVRVCNSKFNDKIERLLFLIRLVIISTSVSFITRLRLSLIS